MQAIAVVAFIIQNIESRAVAMMSRCCVAIPPTCRRTQRINPIIISSATKLLFILISTLSRVIT